jgi:hypothetical protein
MGIIVDEVMKKHHTFDARSEFSVAWKPPC